MKLARLVFPPALILTLVSCRLSAPEVISQDCKVNAVPAGFTRIFISNSAHGGQPSGTTADDPLDGSSAAKFDFILRTIAEGQRPTWGTQTNIAPQNLIVCLSSGTFQTNGRYDWRVHVGHAQNIPLGFTVEKNWKIHGRGVDKTKLQLIGVVQDQFVDKNGDSFSGGSNVVIGTHSEDSSGVEISDLNIDANHDRLTS